MTTLDAALAALEAKAEAATPGKWHWAWVDDLMSPPTKRLTRDSYTVEPAVCATSRLKGGYDDAAFIAAANPEVVKAMARVVREQGALMEAARLSHSCVVAPCDTCIAFSEAEQGRAALASLLTEGGEG